MTGTFIVTVPRPTKPPRKGRYMIDGRWYPRVTSILGVINKPFLIAWILEVGKEEADRLRDEGAAFGTLVHNALEAYDRGDPTLARKPEVVGFARSWRAWKRAHVAELLGIETRVHHPEHGFAGAYDRLVRLNDGRVVLIDFKTSKGADATWGLQLAAYKLAIEYGGQCVDACLVLHMPRAEDGACYAIWYEDMDRATAVFLSVLDVWTHQQAHDQDYKTVKGEPFLWEAGR
ncbi:MAG TPA: PD-(D/E)XK nuclease family protein [Chloroflexota bacterium]|nr:PD-(D/E)XK nuclease family protein [Chloroflexota bacterium]